MTGPDYILDIPGLTPQPGNNSDADAAFRGQPAAAANPCPGARPRPWLAIRWKCCSAYSRIYRNRDGDAYEGRCPRCGKLTKAIIGHGGTNARFFEAG